MKACPFVKVSTEYTMSLIEFLIQTVNRTFYFVGFSDFFLVPVPGLPGVLWGHLPLRLPRQGLLQGRSHIYIKIQFLFLNNFSRIVCGFLSS